MDSGVSSWGYIAACLFVPAAWGLLSSWLFGKLDKRRRSAAEEAARRPPVDYSI